MSIFKNLGKSLKKAAPLIGAGIGYYFGGPLMGAQLGTALGAGIARRRASYEMERQSQYHGQQQQEAQRQIEAQQQEIERLRQQQHQQHTQPQHEDPTQKLLKYADLKQKGIISEEEFQKLKASLLSQI